MFLQRFVKLWKHAPLKHVSGWWSRGDDFFVWGQEGLRNVFGNGKGTIPYCNLYVEELENNRCWIMLLDISLKLAKSGVRNPVYWAVGMCSIGTVVIWLHSIMIRERVFWLCIASTLPIGLSLQLLYLNSLLQYCDEKTEEKRWLSNLCKVTKLTRNYSEHKRLMPKYSY